MSVLDALAVLLAGLIACTMNAVVGSGTLVSFPVLLAIGLPPVAANISNTIGLVPASVGGAWGYRRELAGQRRRVLVLGAAALLGGLIGGVLLLMLPPRSSARSCRSSSSSRSSWSSCSRASPAPSGGAGSGAERRPVRAGRH